MPQRKCRRIPRPPAHVVAAAVALALTCAVLVFRAGQQAGTAASSVAPPPPAGYFGLKPVGSYAFLPDDAAAGALVHRSAWELRPGNSAYNQTKPGHLAVHQVDPASGAYDPRWNRYIIDRISGNFTGTTDEIFQWAAVKWGIPDNLIRAIAFMESDWNQSTYGDFTDNRAQCPPGYQTLPCPVTFGIVGTKSTSWPGIFPWNRDSTAAAVDVLGAWLRGCYEGWVWWLRQYGNRSHGTYHAGDLWGCVGAWYSGNWLDGSASQPDTGENYIYKAQYWYRVRPWLQPGF